MTKMETKKGKKKAKLRGLDKDFPFLLEFLFLACEAVEARFSDISVFVEKEDRSRGYVRRELTA